MPSNDQFARIRLMIGEDGLARLQNAFVIVAGLGAVGSFAVEALARAGVGKIRLIDNDEINPSNINRQLFALHSTVGEPKCLVAEKRVKDINPNCIIQPVNAFINEESAPDLMNENPDFVIDAIDSLNPKVELVSYLRNNEIPFISSMGAALRTDPSLIRIGKMKEANHCRLAAMMRKRLRRRGTPLDFKCVYSEESREHLPAPVYPEISELHGKGRERTVMGSLPTITGIFGLILANCVILELSGFNKSGGASY